MQFAAVQLIASLNKYQSDQIAINYLKPTEFLLPLDVSFMAISLHSLNLKVCFILGPLGLHTLGL